MDDDAADEDEEDAEEAEASRKEATIWVDGLDKIAKHRGINTCIDMSATPYFLGGWASATNTVFPWVVCDFSLTDSIESGLVKVPQLVARDGSGATDAGVFQHLGVDTAEADRGRAGHEARQPEAGGDPEMVASSDPDPRRHVERKRKEWAGDDDPRPPVFILVCKNKRIARTLYEWIGEDKRPAGIPTLNIPELRNAPDRMVTIRVDTGVVPRPTPATPSRTKTPGCG